VIDHLCCTSEAGKKPRLESVWQLSEGPATLDAERRRVVTHDSHANLLMLFPVMPDGMKLSKHEGERDPYRGWLALHWGDHYTPAPMIRCVAENYDPWNADLATVLVPFAGAEPPPVSAEAVAPSLLGGQPPIGRLTLRWGDGTADEIHWSRRLATSVRETSGLDTDAALVHLQRSSDGRVVRGVVAEGPIFGPTHPNGTRGWICLPSALEGNVITWGTMKKNVLRAGAGKVDITPAIGIQLAGDIGRYRPRRRFASACMPGPWCWNRVGLGLHPGPGSPGDQHPWSDEVRGG